MKRTVQTFICVSNGMKAECKSVFTAWGLIRNECYRKGLPIPPLSEILLESQFKQRSQK